MDRVRGALGCACRNAIRFMTKHPPFPTIINNCVLVRPRIFSRIVFIEPGSSLGRTFSNYVEATSTLWYELRIILREQGSVRSFGEGWDWNSSIPLRDAFPGNTGACRVLHVAASTYSMLPSLTWHINNENPPVWTTDDEDDWTDCTSIPSSDDVETLDTSNW